MTAPSQTLTVGQIVATWAFVCLPVFVTLLRLRVDTPSRRLGGAVVTACAMVLSAGAWSWDVYWNPQVNHAVSASLMDTPAFVFLVLVRGYPLLRLKEDLEWQKVKGVVCAAWAVTIVATALLSVSLWSIAQRIDA